MKRISRYAALALVMCAVVVTARPALCAPLIGVTGGVTLAHQAGSDALATKSRTGFGGGFFTSIRVNDGISIVPEMLYVTRGGKIGAQSTNATGTVTGIAKSTYTLTYIELPVLVQFGLPAFGIVRPSVVVGPAFATELSEHLKFEDNFGGSSDTDFLKDTDISGLMGVGLEAGSGALRWLLDVRYQTSVVNLERPERGLGTIRNSSIFVSAGVGWSPSD